MSKWTHHWLRIYCWSGVLLITLLYPLLHTEKYLAKGFTYAVMAFLLLGAIVGWHRLWQQLDRQTQTFLGLLLIWYIYLLLGGYGFSLAYPEADRRFYVASEILLKFLLPFLLLPFLYRCRVFNLEWFKGVVFLAALTATLVLAYDWGTGLPRGQRLAAGPIMYGNLAMLSGVLAALLALYDKRLVVRLALGVVALGSMAASFYSGTRGGWILLLSLPLLYGWTLKAQVDRRYVLAGGLGIILVFVATYLLDTPVKKRLDQAVYEVSRLISDEQYRQGSIGERVAMWEVAGSAFQSAPLTGIGLGNFYAYKKQMIEAGEAPANIMRYKHEHSLYMTLLGSTGLIGVLLFVGVFALLWSRFKKAALAGRSPTSKLLGQMGLIVLLAYLDFGLSESYLFTHRGAAAFFFLITVLLFLISRTEAKPSPALTGSSS